MPAMTGGCCCDEGGGGTTLCLAVIYNVFAAPSDPKRTRSFTTAVPTGATVRFEGPSSEDETVTIDPVTGIACFPGTPSAGEWFLTVSHPCFVTNTGTVEVIAGEENNHDLFLFDSDYMQWNFEALGLSYSDDFGSTTCELGNPSSTNAFRGTYTYESADCGDLIDCGGAEGFQHIDHQTADVEVIIEIVPVLLDANTIRFHVHRKVGSVEAYEDCLLESISCTKRAVSAGAPRCFLYSYGFIDVDCGDALGEDSLASVDNQVQDISTTADCACGPFGTPSEVTLYFDCFNCAGASTNNGINFSELDVFGAVSW